MNVVTLPFSSYTIEMPCLGKKLQEMNSQGKQQKNACMVKR
jgi:hypothetical protein